MYCIYVLLVKLISLKAMQHSSGANIIIRPTCLGLNKDDLLEVWRRYRYRVLICSQGYSLFVSTKNICSNLILLPVTLLTAIFYLSFPSTVWWLMTSLQWIVYTVTIAKTCHFPGDLCLVVGFPVELFNMLTWILETAALSGEGRGYYHTLSSLLPNTRTDKDDSKTWCKIMIFLSKCPLWHYNHTKQRFLFSVFSLPITCIWKDQLMWKASNDPTTWIC